MCAGQALQLSNSSAQVRDNLAAVRRLLKSQLACQLFSSLHTTLVAYSAP